MHRRRFSRAKVVLTLAMAFCAASGFAQESPVHPDRWPAGHWPIAPEAKTAARIADLLRRMTIEEKVGQVIQGDIGSVTPDDVRKYHLGSVLNGGNSGPGGNDLALAPKWLELADAFYAASIDKSSGGVGIPVIWGTDAVHGHSNIIGATLFPHNVGLGAANDPALIRRIRRRDPRDRTGMDFCADHHRAAGCALGPHL